MGLIRFFLAASVVAVHAGGSVFGYGIGFGGEVAVELFFIISGFYMTMILVEKYKGNKILFFKNRFLRLYPLYLASIILIFILGYICRNFYNYNLNSYNEILLNYRNGVINLPTAFFMTISNLTMLFQDIVMFLRINHGALSFTADYSTSSPPVFMMLLIPPAWTLSIEVYFYIIIPFIFNKFRVIVVIFFISVLIRIVNMCIYYHDPFTYRFFPNEISLFLLGCISYYLYRKWSFKQVSNHALLIILLVLITGFLWPILHFTKYTRFIYYFFFAFLMPYIFEYSKRSRFDGFIGELSYPIYIIHLFAISVITLIIGKLKLTFPIEAGKFIVSLALSTLLSIVMITLLQKPFEIIRKKPFLKK